MKKLLLLFVFSLSLYSVKAQIPPAPGLRFSYDDAGNQTKRYYKTNMNQKKSATPKLLADQFTTYPNPTDGITNLKWEKEVSGLVQKIELVGYTTPYYREIPFTDTDLAVEINLSNQIRGVYFVQFSLKDGTVVTKKLIKN